MERKLQLRRVYRHFKGMLYFVKETALNSETGDEEVVYAQLYAPYKTYVRPKEMFLSEVDHEKYPDIKQKYRFELCCEEEKND